MANNFISLRNIGTLLFGSGKDQYTQTAFPYIQQFMLSKGTDYVDTSNNNKFHLYQTTAHLRAVIDRKALMFANGKWKHYKLTSSGVKEVENSEYVDVLENPNYLQNGVEWLAQGSILRSIYGNKIQFVNSVGKKPKLIFNLPAAYVQVEKTGKLYRQISIEDCIEKYVLTYGDVIDTFTPDEIIHLRDPNPIDPVIGLSKIDALGLEISNVRGAKGFRNRIITADAMLGILSTKVTDGGIGGIGLEEKEQKRISDGFKSKWGMQEGKGDILQTEASVDWIPMSYPTKDLLLFEEVEENFKTIIDIYGLNANIFSFKGQSTYENMEHGVRAAYRDTIIPEAMSEALSYSKYWGLTEKAEWLEMDYSHLDVLQEDASDQNKSNAEAIKLLIDAGLTPEKIEEITGIDVGSTSRPVEVV